MRRPPLPWIPAFSGIATALRGPRKWMRTLGRRVLAYCMAALPHPSPPGFRPLPESPMALRRPRKRIKVADFHSNRTCRLPPAHQGMKIGSIG